MATTRKAPTPADLFAACEKKDSNAVIRLVNEGVKLENDPRGVYLDLICSAKHKKRELVDLLLNEFPQLVANDPVAHATTCTRLLNIIPATEDTALRYLISVHGMNLLIADHQSHPAFTTLVLSRVNCYKTFIAEKKLINNETLIRLSQEFYTDLNLLDKPECTLHEIYVNAKVMVVNSMTEAYQQVLSDRYDRAENLYRAKKYVEQREVVNGSIAIYKAMLTLCTKPHLKDHIRLKLGSQFIALANSLRTEKSPHQIRQPDIKKAILDYLNKALDYAQNCADSTESIAVSTESMMMLAACYEEQAHLFLDAHEKSQDIQNEIAAQTRIIEVVLQMIEIREFLFRQDSSVALELAGDYLQAAVTYAALYPLTFDAEHARKATKFAKASAELLKKTKGDPQEIAQSRTRAHAIENEVDLKWHMKQALHQNDLAEVDRLYEAWYDPTVPDRFHYSLSTFAAMIVNLDTLKYLMEKYKNPIQYDPQKPLSHFLFAVCCAAKKNRIDLLNWLYENDRYLTIGGGVCKEHIDAAAGKLPIDALSTDNRDALGFSPAHYALLSGGDFAPYFNHPKAGNFIVNPIEDGALQGTNLFWLFAFHTDKLKNIINKFPHIDIDWHIKPSDYIIKHTEDTCSDLLMLLANDKAYDVITNLLDRNKERPVDLQIKNYVGETLEECLLQDKQLKLLDSIKARQNRLAKPASKKVLRTKTVEEKPKPVVVVPKVEVVAPQTPEAELRDKLLSLKQELDITSTLDINNNMAYLSLSGPADKLRQIHTILKNLKLSTDSFNEKNKQVSFGLKLKIGPMYDLWVKNKVFLKLIQTPVKGKEKITVTESSKPEAQPIKLTQENHQAFIHALERIFCHAHEIRTTWNDKDNLIILKYDDVADVWSVRKPGEDPVNGVRIANIKEGLIRDVIVPRIIAHFKASGEARVTHHEHDKTLSIQFLVEKLSSLQALEKSIYAYLAPGELAIPEHESKLPAPSIQSNDPTPQVDTVEVKKTALTQENIKDYLSAVIDDPQQKFLFLHPKNSKNGNKLIFTYNPQGAPIIGTRHSITLMKSIVDAINQQFPDFINIKIAESSVSIAIPTHGLSLEDLLNKLDAVKKHFSHLINQTVEVKPAIPPSQTAVSAPKSTTTKIAPSKEPDKIAPLSKIDQDRKNLKDALSKCTDSQRKNLTFHLEQLTAIPSPAVAAETSNPQHYFFAYLLHAFRLTAIIAKVVQQSHLSDANDIFYALRNVIRHAFINQEWDRLYKWLNPLVVDLKAHLPALKPVDTLGQHISADLFLNREIFARLDDNLSPFRDKLKTRTLGRIKISERQKYISQYEQILQTLATDNDMPKNWLLDATIMLHAVIGKCVSSEKTNTASDSRDLYRTLGHSFELYYPQLAVVLHGLCTQVPSETLDLETGIKY